MNVDTELRDRLSAEQSTRFDAALASDERRDRSIRAPMHDLTPVHYMDELERETHRLFIGKNGKLYRAFDRRLFDTRTIQYLNGLRTIFVMDEFGNLYATAGIHHSSFFKGGTVTAAGEIVVEDGLLGKWTDQSDEYGPVSASNDMALGLLRTRGIAFNRYFMRNDKVYDRYPAGQSANEKAAFERVKEILAAPNTDTRPQTRYYRIDREDDITALTNLVRESLPPGSYAHFVGAGRTSTVTFRKTVSTRKYLIQETDSEGREEIHSLTRSEIIELLTEREITSIAVTIPQGVPEQPGSAEQRGGFAGLVTRLGGLRRR